MATTPASCRIITDVLTNEQLKANDVLIEINSNNPNYAWTVNSPISCAGAAKQPPNEAPDIGAHTEEILTALG